MDTHDDTTGCGTPTSDRVRYRLLLSQPLLPEIILETGREVDSGRIQVGPKQRSSFGTREKIGPDVQRALYLRTGLAIFSMMVPPWTCMLSLVPKGAKGFNSFYIDAHWPVIVAFWVIAFLCQISSYFFLTRLSHIWTLEFFSTKLASRGILINYETQKSYWKRTFWDVFLFTISAAVVVFLLIKNCSTEAAAVGLQLCISLRNGYEGLLARPAVKLPVESGQLTVVSEKAVRQFIEDHMGETPSEINFECLVDALLRSANAAKTSVVTEDNGSKHSLCRLEAGDSPWTGMLLQHAMKLRKVKSNESFVAWCCGDKCNRNQCNLNGNFDVEYAGDVTWGIMDEVVPQIELTLSMIGFFTNGQAILGVAFLLASATSLAERGL